MKRFTPFQKRIITTVLLVVIAVSGYFLSKVVEQQMKRSEFSDLLLKTQMIALLINPEEIQELNADDTDIDNPTYLSLKRKLVEVKKIDSDARYIYILGLNDERQQFFFVGSELMTSSKYMHPGTINQHATRNDIKNHIVGATYVYGPYENNTGEWISAYAPIHSEQGEVLAVVRVDVEAEKITLLINIIRRGILLITALMLFSLLLIYINASRKW